MGTGNVQGYNFVGGNTTEALSFAYLELKVEGVCFVEIFQWNISLGDVVDWR